MPTTPDDEQSGQPRPDVTPLERATFAVEEAACAVREARGDRVAFAAAWETLTRAVDALAALRPEFPRDGRT